MCAFVCFSSVGCSGVLGVFFGMCFSFSFSSFFFFWGGEGGGS